jgi:hypothetical protein
MTQRSPSWEGQQGERAVERELASGQAQEPSISHLVSDLIADAQTLVRREFDLARQEIKIEIGKAREAGMQLAVGAGITAAGAILLLLMLVRVMIDVFSVTPWVAYLIVGGVLTAVGAIMLVTGSKRLKEVDPVPHETIESVRKDVSWITEQNPSDKT